MGLEELGSCWQAGRQLALATEAWSRGTRRSGRQLLGSGLQGALGGSRQDGPPRSLPRG